MDKNFCVDALETTTGTSSSLVAYRAMRLFLEVKYNMSVLLHEQLLTVVADINRFLDQIKGR
jgi:hypothetical protein